MKNAKFHFSKVSSNVKTGPIPVTTSTFATCSDNCSFKGKGCYAKYSNLGGHWKKVTQGERGDSWEVFLGKIRTIPKNGLWRHNQAGDLPGTGDRINGKMVSQLVEANKGRRGFTYTHKPVLGKGKIAAENRRIIAEANKNGFRINLSADNLKQADQLADLGIGPVCVVVPSDAPKISFTPAGRMVFACPATYRDDVTCSSCGICQKERKGVVSFPAHGSARKTVSLKVIQG